MGIRFLRVLITAAPMLFILGGGRTASNPFPAAELNNLAAAFEGRAGFYVKDLRDGFVYAYHADDRFPPASAIKLPIMVALYREAAAARVDLDRTYPMPDDISRIGTGDLKGQEMIRLPLRGYCRLMITKSDNMATDLIIRTLGIATINRLLEKQGLHSTHLSMEIGRWHYTIVGMGNEPISKANDALVEEHNASLQSDDKGIGYSDSLHNNVIGPRDMGVLLERLQKGRLADKAATAQMFDFLLQAGRGRIGQYLRPEVKVAKKHGSSRRIAADAGIVYLKRGPVVFVGCTLANDPTSTAGRELISQIARIAIGALDPSAVDPIVHCAIR